MGVVRRFAVAGLDEAARKAGRRRGLAVERSMKPGRSGRHLHRWRQAQYLGCVGKVANGINTVLRHEAQVCIPRSARRDWRYISGSDG